MNIYTHGETIVKQIIGKYNKKPQCTVGIKQLPVHKSSCNELFNNVKRQITYNHSIWMIGFMRSNFCTHREALKTKIKIRALCTTYANHPWNIFIAVVAVVQSFFGIMSSCKTQSYFNLEIIQPKIELLHFKSQSTIHLLSLYLH